MRPLCFALAASIVCAFFPSPSDAQLDDYCRRDAQRYDALLTYKRATTPTRVADVYVEQFSTKAADADAQAVWRRMQKDGSSMERAIETHLGRYHSERSADERAELRNRIMSQIETMSLIHELVFEFERVAITPELAAETMAESWSSPDWGVANVDRYVEMIESRAAGYLNAGLDEEQAAVRAAVEARAAVERDRGVSRGLIVDKGHACYKDELNKMEIRLRHIALKSEMGPLTDAEAAALTGSWDPEGLSRLSYYTHIRFGPRDYSFDRLRAWQTAAQ